MKILCFITKVTLFILTKGVAWIDKGDVLTDLMPFEVYKLPVKYVQKIGIPAISEFGFLQRRRKFMYMIQLFEI